MSRETSNDLHINLRAEFSAFALRADFTARGGETLAIVGHNGAGKTTLARSIAGLLPQAEGSVRLGGDELIGLSPQERRVGLVFQRLALFPHMSVLKNIAFGQGTNLQRVQEFPRRFGLEELAQRKASTLSGGEAQRVAIARTLAIEPRVLILDEPMSSLDLNHRAGAMRVLQESLASFSGPSLLITHDAAVAMTLASRFVWVEEGKCAEPVTLAEIARGECKPGLLTFCGYQKLYHHPSLAGVWPHQAEHSLVLHASDFVLDQSLDHCAVEAIERTPAGGKVRLRCEDDQRITLHCKADTNLHVGDRAGVRIIRSEGRNTGNETQTPPSGNNAEC